MFRSSIDLIDIEAEPALREGLEALGARVCRYPIGQAAHVLTALSQPERAPYLVIAGHGSPEGFYLPELAPDVEAAQPFHGPLDADLIRERVVVTGSVVLSLACATGRQEMASAWLDAGASAYIAPEGYPEADDALLYALHLFWQLLSLECPLDDAHAAASAIGRDAASFVLHESTPTI